MLQINILIQLVHTIQLMKLTYNTIQFGTSKLYCEYIQYHCKHNIYTLYPTPLPMTECYTPSANPSSATSIFLTYLLYESYHCVHCQSESMSPVLNVWRKHLSSDCAGRRLVSANVGWKL